MKCEESLLRASACIFLTPWFISSYKLVSAKKAWWEEKGCVVALLPDAFVLALLDVYFELSYPRYSWKLTLRSSSECAEFVWIPWPARCIVIIDSLTCDYGEVPIQFLLLNLQAVEELEGRTQFLKYDIWVSLTYLGTPWHTTQKGR